MGLPTVAHYAVDIAKELNSRIAKHNNSIAET
jgi:hypothetical protein